MGSAMIDQPDGEHSLSADVSHTHNLEQARRADAIFAEALEHTDCERFLNKACSGEPALRSMVESLLEADREAVAFLESSWCRRVADGDEDTRMPIEAPRWAGPYRLLRRIGQGGMGVVFLAARADEQYDKLVAIKLLRASEKRPDAERRFERECQILADLEHPNIARLYDAGRLDSGQPYLVMEYVDGQAIDGYCDSNRLGISARLDLFLTVCEAVEHAHRRLLIHRDLKPANILVTRKGTPKLLDFGIARPIEPTTSTNLAITSAGHGPMTPSHASPEQIQGVPLTTGSDVYTLGVLLYQLLVGRLPYQLEKSAPAELARSICDQIPEAPSRTVASQDAAVDRYGMTVRELKKRLAGDLDAIVARALRKDPAERYVSVSQLADDLRRHLAQRPVRARRGTWRYHAAKFVRRNRVRVALTASLIVTFVIFSIVLLLQVTRTEAERAKSERVAEFFTDVFAYADPETAQGHSVTVQEVLDKGIARYRQELDDQPETQALIFHTAGAIYQRLGLFETAEPLVDDALEIRREVLGPDHPEVADTLRTLSSILLANRRDLDRAEQLRREALDIYQHALGANSLPVAECKEGLAWFALARGNADEAVRLRREAIAIARQEFGESHRKTRNFKVSLAEALRHQGRLEEAEGLAREAVSSLADDDSFVLRAHSSLATILYARDEQEEAYKIYGKTIELARRVYSEHHPELGAKLSRFGLIASRFGDYETADAALRESVAIRRIAHGADHLLTAVSLANLGGNQRLQGAYDDAEVSYLEAIGIVDRALPPGAPTRSNPLVGLGRVRLDRGDAAGAESPLREALALRSQKGVEPYRVAAVEVELGRCLVELGTYGEAEPLLTSAEQTLTAIKQERARKMRTTALEALVRLYELQSLPARAEPYRDLLLTSQSSSSSERQ